MITGSAAMAKVLASGFFSEGPNRNSVGFCLVGLAFGTHLIIIRGFAEGFFRLAGELLRRVFNFVVGSHSGPALFRS